MSAKRLGWTIVLAATLAASQAVAADKSGSKVYRWTDKNGVVHYGDRVPPEHISHDREILNDHGIPVAREEGEKTEAERVAEAEAAALEAEIQRVKAEADERDGILLNTYLSVREIESLRNQRTEMIDSQIKLTELYLDSLHLKLGKLQKDASRFRPYSSDPNAPPIHHNLARELSDTLDSIILYEQNLEDARMRKDAVVQKFAADIDRFKELKGLQ